MKAPGASQYNPGWHEALSMRSLLITSEAVTRAALMREESRGAHTRLDFPGESEEWVKYNVIVKQGADGAMEVEKRLRPDAAAEARGDREREDRGPRGRQGRSATRSEMAKRTFKVWRGDKEGGEFETFDVEVDPGMVVLDVLHRIQARAGATTSRVRWNCKAGKCGSC